MAKVTKDQLKSLVKECLMEILVEGLGTSNAAALSESRSPAAKHTDRHDRVHPADMVSYGLNNKKVIKNDAFEKTVKSTVKNMTSDPVMQSLFEETAKTTLQKQAAGEKPGSAAMSLLGSNAPEVESGIDPADMFGNAASKWADLAFAAPVNKNR